MRGKRIKMQSEVNRKKNQSSARKEKKQKRILKLINTRKQPTKKEEKNFGIKSP